MTTTTSTTADAAERRAGVVWPAIIVGLLVACIAGQATIALAARSSPGLTVQRPGDGPPPGTGRPQ